MLEIKGLVKKGRGEEVNVEDDVKERGAVGERR